jgi:predicted SprT family Zn-dependent metalloprotease
VEKKFMNQSRTKGMKATKDYIARKFEEYNQLCFGGKLAPIPIILSHARTFLGQIAYKRKKNADGTWRYYDFVFKISTLIDLPETEVEDTILHEMIHYYIFSNQIQETSPHGKIFTAIMTEINKRFDRHITISYKKTKTDYENDVEIRQHLVCVVRFNDNRTGICVAAKTRIFNLWDSLANLPNVAECKWYSSIDPFFNRYPRSLNAKLYRISAEDLKAHLQDALPLVRHGNTIRIQK